MKSHSALRRLASLVPLAACLFIAPGLLAQFDPRVWGNAPGQSANNGGQLNVTEGEWVFLDVYNHPYPSSIQWLRDGVEIPDATSNWLDLDPVRLDQAGSYRARVTHQGQTLTTGTIAVSVLSGLEIGQSPPNPVLAGTSITLTASAPGAGLLQDFVWRHRGAVVSGATGATLVIAGVNVVSGGEYEVTATYTVLGRPVTSDPHQVAVYSRFEGPIIVTPPRPQTTRPDGPALMTVGVSGTAPFTYQWQKDGVDLPGATAFFLFGEQLPATAAGNYRVIVRNAGGAITSAPVALTMATPPVPNAEASALVNTGRLALTVHTNTSLSAATASFAAAVGLDPDHPLANLFFGVTRVVDLLHQTPALQFMDRWQIQSTNRDIYRWTAEPAQTPDGELKVPAGVNAAESTVYLRDHLIPQLQGARENLARLTDAGFTAALTAAETTGDAVTVDQADLHVVRAGLAVFEFWLRTMGSWNLSANLTDIENLATNELLTIQRLLADYPSLLAYAEPGQVAPARAAFEEAIDAYVQAAGLMLVRSPDVVRLFGLEPEDLAEEAAFRQFLLDLKATLAEPRVLNASAAEAPGLEDATQYQVKLGALWDVSRSWRSLLPGFLVDEPDPVTLPDPTFGGGFVSAGPPAILLSPIDRRFNVGEPVTLGVVAVGAAPFRYQWFRRGPFGEIEPIAGATSAALAFANPQAADEGVYAVLVENDLGEAWSNGAWLELNSPPVRMQATVGGGGFVISVTGSPGGTWMVQSSADLENWTDFQPLPNFNGHAAVVDPMTAGQNARFYRAIQR